MTELSALAVSEGYAACDDDGELYCQKRPSRAFFDSLKARRITRRARYAMQNLLTRKTVQRLSTALTSTPYSRTLLRTTSTLSSM